MRTFSAVWLAACAAVFSVPAVAGGNAKAGAALYEARCSVCHSMDHNGVGPAHRGVYGRAAASAPDFKYSDALKASRIVWGDKTLDRWLADPEKAVPGQRMYVSVPNKKERADLIAYLKEASAAK
jgi:cytochrome c